MTFFELILIAVGLSMDAFAVSICKGLSTGQLKTGHYLTTGIYFGGFQAIMPFLGFLAGYNFQNVISSFDYIIAFALLSVIGINMIRESGEESCENADFSPKAMLPLAVATSIDALAVGVTFAALGCNFISTFTKNIIFNVIIIGITTFIISVAGVKIGNVFGTRYKKKAEITGGVILILIGIKIFAEHFINLPF